MRKFLGIDIGGTKTAVIYAREKEENRIEIVDKSQFETTQVKQTINEIFSYLDEMIDRNELKTDEISAIGISCGGPLDSERGIVMSPPNLPGWDNIPIVDMVKRDTRSLAPSRTMPMLVPWQNGSLEPGLAPKT